jgi:hypothetical protein
MKRVGAHGFDFLSLSAASKGLYVGRQAKGMKHTESEPPRLSTRVREPPNRLSSRELRLSQLRRADNDPASVFDALSALHSTTVGDSDTTHTLSSRTRQPINRLSSKELRQAPWSRADNDSGSRAARGRKSDDSTAVEDSDGTQPHSSSLRKTQRRRAASVVPEDDGTSHISSGKSQSKRIKVVAPDHRAPVIKRKLNELNDDNDDDVHESMQERMDSLLENISDKEAFKTFIQEQEKILSTTQAHKPTYNKLKENWDSTWDVHGIDYMTNGGRVSVIFLTLKLTNKGTTTILPSRHLRRFRCICLLPVMPSL